MDISEAQKLNERNLIIMEENEKMNRKNSKYLEKNLKDVNMDVKELRSHYSDRISDIKQKFDEVLLEISIKNNLPDDDGTSSVITGQCLGCGRASSINRNPPTPNQSGPETLRAGFKIPISPLSPFKGYAPGPPGGSETVLRPLSGVMLSKTLDLPQANSHDTDTDIFIDSYTPQYTSIRPKTSSGVYSASQRQSRRGVVSAGLVPVETGVQLSVELRTRKERAELRATEKSDMYKFGKDEGKGSPLKSSQRSGFAGKKSMRAEHAYAPERFTVPPDFTAAYNNLKIKDAGGVNFKMLT
jgi:hypothetical protein